MAAAPETALTGNLGWLLNQASHALATETTAALDELDLGPRGFCVLKAAMSGELTQIEIAQMAGLDKTTMVVTVDRLEEQGLARRVPSATDRRARVVTVTRAGERRVAQAEKIIDRVHDEVLADIPAQQRKVFVEALRHLACGRPAETAHCAQPVRRARSR